MLCGPLIRTGEGREGSLRNMMIIGEKRYKYDDNSEEEVYI